MIHFRNLGAKFTRCGQRVVTIDRGSATQVAQIDKGPVLDWKDAKDWQDHFRIHPDGCADCMATDRRRIKPELIDEVRALAKAYRAALESSPVTAENLSSSTLGRSIERCIQFLRDDS